jgi:phage-related protein
VLEIVASRDGGTWRLVYTVRFAGVIYVFHAFAKKSVKGRATPLKEIRLIRRRLSEAERDHWERTNP